MSLSLEDVLLIVHSIILVSSMRATNITVELKVHIFVAVSNSSNLTRLKALYDID